jgi:hypothetical protein
MMSNILCIDPGGTSGIAIFSASKERKPELLKYLEVPKGTQGFIDFYRENEPLYRWKKIVCESFTLRVGVKFPDLTPVYIIGALEALVKDGVEIIFQSPSLKGLCDDDRLKFIEMHQRGSGHANDAIRHGIIYLRNTKHMPTIEMTWPREG